MNTIPGGLRTDQQPPMAIPLAHFVVALGFLSIGAVMGTVMIVSPLPGLDSIALIHVLFVGWICLTIMGAMTQFVPVWSGVPIHSRGLAIAQLLFVSSGLLGFVGCLLTGRLEVLPVFAALLLAGVWTFVYNVGRTLWQVDSLDRTERHFAFALGCFAVLAPLGGALAIDFTTPMFESVALARGDVLMIHVTLAIFGGVLSTIVGGLYQLSLMFTQTMQTPFDRSLQLVEELTFPVGVVLFAVGRGVGSVPLARIGAIAMVVGLLAFCLCIGRRLFYSTVDRSPMTARYWIVVASLSTWAILAGRAWWSDPVGYQALIGAPGTTAVLVVGVCSFVVVGTLYHIVPFIIWLERYSDRLGFEQVPMIDDLYSSRLERADFWTVSFGYVGIAASGLLALPVAVTAASGLLALVGFSMFVVNMLYSIHRHGPGGLNGVVVNSVDAVRKSSLHDDDTRGQRG